MFTYFPEALDALAAVIAGRGSPASSPQIGGGQSWGVVHWAQKSARQGKTVPLREIRQERQLKPGSEKAPGGSQTEVPEKWSGNCLGRRGQRFPIRVAGESWFPGQEAWATHSKKMTWLSLILFQSTFISLR